MRYLPALLLMGSPALAAPEGTPFFSLFNTDFVVLLAFLIFVGVLVYFKVPRRLAGMLDKRAAGIHSELDEARAARDEAQAILTSYERKQREVQEQSQRIVTNAREEAEAAAAQAKEDLKASIARRLHAAEEQIGAAEASAVREIRDRAIAVAVAAAGEVIAKKLTAAEANALIDDSIATVDAKLH